MSEPMGCQSVRLDRKEGGEQDGHFLASLRRAGRARLWRHLGLTLASRAVKRTSCIALSDVEVLLVEVACARDQPSMASE